MSDQTRKYVIKIIDDDGNSVTSQFNWEDRKSFCKAIENNKKKKITASILTTNGSEIPMYLINNKAIFKNSNNKTFCIDTNNGRLHKDKKYSIIKGSRTNNDKYVVKKDKNSYYRYSIDGHLIDSIRKKSFQNDYTYSAYNRKDGKEIDIKIGSANNIDEAIESTKQIRINRFGLQDEYKIEEQFFEATGIYPNGNDLVSTSEIFRSNYNFIKKLCIIEGVVEENDKKFYAVDNLINKLDNKENKHFSSAKSYILHELFNTNRHKLFRLSKRMKRIEKVRRENVSDIQNSGEQVEIVFFDKKGEETSSYTLKPMKFFDERNVLGVDSKTGKITKGGDVIKGQDKHRYYFVKPVGQPMYLFKKESDEFSNHSNFQLTDNDSTRKIESAGSITIKNGKITNISNSSGHFKPPVESNKVALTYIASQTNSCRIDDVIHPDCKTNDGYIVSSDVNDTFDFARATNRNWFEVIEEVAKLINKTDVLEINTKSARMAAKKRSHSII